MTISSKVESICQSSSQKGFVRIDNYSSKTGEWKLKEFDADEYQNALEEVQRIEDGIRTLAKTVSETPNDQLSRLRFVVRPCAKDIKNVPLYIEVSNTINQLKMQLAELKESKSGITDQTKELERLLHELQDRNVQECSWKMISKVQRQMKTLRSWENWLKTLPAGYTGWQYPRLRAQRSFEGNCEILRTICLPRASYPCKLFQ